MYRDSISLVIYRPLQDLFPKKIRRSHSGTV